jgi:AraC-like DNA-binding protein
MINPSVRSRRRAGPSVQAWAFPHLISWVEGHCGDASPIRRLPGLDALDGSDARIPEATAEAAWRLAETLTHDEAIGVHVAESLPRGGLDLIEYAVRSSASLGSGLERLAHYGRVLSDRVAARIDANDRGLALMVGDVGASALHHARAEFALATALKLARDVTGFEIVPVQVAFAHDRPNDTAEHRRFFRGPIRFGAGTNTMLLSAADAARTLPGADAALVAIVRRRLDEPLSKEQPTDAAPLSARVRRLLMEDLGQATLTADSVARTLAMSRRTLSRQLAEEGTSFRAIFDAVRAELARALLQDRSLSIADVAFFLQYSEPAAFHRSFRRWTGQTPQSYRLS